MKFILFLLMLSFVVSCSQKSTTSEVDESDTAIELTDSDELLDDENADVTDENTEELVSEETPVQSNEEIVIEDVAEQKEYTVQKNDTLMMISFKIYGDYSKWKELSDLNQNVISDSKKLSAGTVLKYNAPTESFSWTPEGNPYLIKSGDTLGKISFATYGANKFWRNIWENNKPLIKDPNKIYAGFTIFTPEIEGRDVATK
ncbi:MAG: LysM peptidoglycan-binding domain-containing protein [Bacteriovoracaceae bacterium]|nr:LysM peptidoglycan-binding domain-containing protein [Bacteriovoracaceae bacterium]